MSEENDVQEYSAKLAEYVRSAIQIVRFRRNFQVNFRFYEQDELPKINDKVRLWQEVEDNANHVYEVTDVENFAGADGKLYSRFFTLNNKLKLPSYHGLFKEEPYVCQNS